MIIVLQYIINYFRNNANKNINSIKHLQFNLFHYGQVRNI